MRNIVVLFLLFSSLVSVAQVNYFAPVNSIWYYQHKYSSSQTIDYTKIVTLGNTLIGTKASSILHIDSAEKKASEFSDSIYVHYDSGKVYRYFTQSGKWGLQYDFNLQAGDTFICYASAFTNILDSFTVTVDSIGLTIINGVS